MPVLLMVNRGQGTMYRAPTLYLIGLASAG